jgi:glucokinase
MRFFLGVEIGGTKLQLAVGRGEGEPFRAFWRGPIDVAGQASGIQQQISAGIDELLRTAHLERHQIGGVAIGFGGPVDTARGRIVTSHQVDGWDDFALTNWFESKFSWPAVLHNDADSAAYAEARFGAGRGFDPVLYVTVGSGIGGGLICGGQIFRGSGAGAMEIGHLRPGNSPRHIAATGSSVESVASGFGIEDRARKAIAEWSEAAARVDERLTASDFGVVPGRNLRNDPEHCSTLLALVDGDSDRISTRLIAQAAGQGDRLSRELLSDATSTLGWALAQAIALVNPARIVVGGGVSLIGQELFFEPLRRSCHAAVFQPFADVAEIVPAGLGEEVVVHGAVALARSAFYREPELKAFVP